MKRINILFLLLFATGTPYAQSGNKPLKDVINTVDSAGKKLKHVFSGKKKKSESTQKEQKGGNAADNNNSDRGSVAGKAGSVSPNVKWVDDFQIGPFMGGTAILRKGEINMLISPLAEPMLPASKLQLGTLWSMTAPVRDFVFCQDFQKKEQFLVNRQGKKVVSLTAAGLEICDIDCLEPGYICLRDKNYKYIAVADTLGRISKISTPALVECQMLHFSEGLLLAGQVTPGQQGQPSQIAYGFKNLQDQWAVKPAYISLEPFSEGLAIAGKKDMYGEIKYGFIDKQGNVVIPFQYSERPSPFKSGISFIKPPVTSTSDIRYAAINTKGEIVFTVTQKNAFKFPISVDLKFASNGYFFGSSSVMDARGNTQEIKTFLAQRGITAPASTIDIVMPSEKSSPYSYRVSKLAPDYFIYRITDRNAVQMYGIYWMKTGKVIPPVFTTLHNFDPVSKLALAKIETREGPKTKVVHDGYINEDGVFVILKKAASDW